MPQVKGVVYEVERTDSVKGAEKSVQEGSREVEPPSSPSSAKLTDRTMGTSQKLGRGTSTDKFDRLPRSVSRTSNDTSWSSGTASTFVPDGAVSVSNISSATNSPREKPTFNSRWELTSLIAAGEFSTVHTAVRKHSGKEFAVKVWKLHAGRTTVSQAIQCEVDLLRKVRNCKYCAACLESFCEADRWYVVMTKFDRTFSEWLDVVHVTERTLRHAFSHVLCALEFIHRQGIVHRDVQPSNLMCLPQHGSLKDRIVLGGFAHAATLSSEGLLVDPYGEAALMCPEMMAGHPYDGKADIWSLGIMAYVLMLGKLPNARGRGRAMTDSVTEASGTHITDFEVFDWRSDPSEGAVRFMKSLLRTHAHERPTALEVLQSDFVTAELSNENLRPMINQARELGVLTAVSRGKTIARTG